MGPNRGRALLGAGAALSFAALGCSFDVSGLAPDPESAPNSYACACDCSNDLRTATLPIVLSSDDAEEDVTSSAMDLTDPTLHITQAATRKFVGLRFQNVGVPAGATIVSAQVQFTAALTTSGATNLEWVGQAADDAPTFGTAPGNLSVRPETAAVVAWAPASWNAGEAAAPERSPDLTSIVQEIVSRPGWKAGNALVLIIRGTGQRTAQSFDGSAAAAPQLVVQYKEPSIHVALQVCMTSALNPNLGGAGTTPTDDQLQADCQGRVQTTLGDLNNACSYPSVCSCGITPSSTRFAANCNQPCAEVPLAADCSNFNPPANVTTATNAPGDAPVCVVHSPLTSALFGQRSACQVVGSVTLTTPDDSKSSATSGLMEFAGTPCPGQSCAVGFDYRLDVAPITFSKLFQSATFTDLAALGESLPGGQAVLAADGTGAFPPDSTFTSARGRRDDDSRAYKGANDDAINVALGWSGPSPSCSVSGALFGAVDPELKRCENAGPTANAICTQDSDCTNDPGCSDGVCNCEPVTSSNVTLALNLSGPLVNQPPIAHAGADQLVECNLPGRASFTLAATVTDPDGNAPLFSWFRGSRSGPEVGFAPRVQLEQAVGTTSPYVVRVIDTFGQSDEDTTHVQVVDTTAPVIACNAPPTITPPSTPVSFDATASDVCDASVVPTLTGFSCFRFNGSGKKIDLTHACAVTLSGNRISIAHTNGVGEHIAWTAQVTDASGNSSTASCEVVVARP